MCFLILHVITIGIFLPKTTSLSLHEDVLHYTNEWTVHIAGDRGTAERIAKSEGFTLDHELKEVPGLYFLKHHHYPEKMHYTNNTILERLQSYEQVRHANQHMVLPFELKIVTPETLPLYFDKKHIMIIPQVYTCPRSKNRAAKSKYRHQWNDWLYPAQFYIHNCSEEGGYTKENSPTDHNVVPVWQMGFYGTNVRVVVIDDGMETAHTELKDNYDSSLSIDLYNTNKKTPDPTHTTDWLMDHGTKCAGIIAMKANNEACGVGIAPNVTLGAIRLFGPSRGVVADKSGYAILFKYKDVHITSNSWSTMDNGGAMPSLTAFTYMALKTSAREGRNGKGVVHVFASGNGKQEEDNCGADAWINSVYTIAIAGVDSDGKISDYSERCPGVMATAYSGDERKPFRMVSTTIGNRCTTGFTGTSAATPLAAGILALLLDANPDLTARDVQHLIALTSQVAPLQDNVGVWKRNGRGFWVSDDFGFGLLDALELVKAGKNFRSVPSVNQCVISIINYNKNQINTKFNGHEGLEIEGNADPCKKKPSEVKYLEHVQVQVTMTYPRRGDVQVKIKSPRGTESQLLYARPNDTSRGGFKDWIFDSVQQWGEDPEGRWVIDIFDKTGSYFNSGHVQELKLVLTGTKEEPHHYKTGNRQYHPFTLPRN